MTVGNDNHKSIEAAGIRDLLFQSGADEVDLIGTRSRLNVNTVKDYTEVQSLTDYDKVFVQLSPANFFGGKWDDRLEWIIRELSHVDPSKIYILHNDPNIPMTNAALQLMNRGEVWCNEYIDAWEEINTHATHIVPGPDVTKFIGWTPLRWNYVPWFSFIFDKCLTYQTPMEKPTDHVCYWGAHRGRWRELKTRHFLSDNRLHVRLIGYASEETSIYTRFYRRVKQYDLGGLIQQCYTSLIIGDEAHQNNVVTYRFWEAIAGASLPVIDCEYDPSESLQAKLGVKLDYASGPDDILNAVEGWSTKRVVDLQEAAQAFLSKEANEARLWTY